MYQMLSRILLGVMCSAYAAVALSDGIAPPTRHFNPDVPPAELTAEINRFAMLLRDATKEAEARMKQMGLNVGDSAVNFYTQPATIQQILPFKWNEIENALPLMLLRTDQEASKITSRSSPLSFLQAFNIQLVTDEDGITWPTTINLEMTLRSYDALEESTLVAEMNWDTGRSAYYLTDAFDTLQSLMGVIDELTPDDIKQVGTRYKPELKLTRLGGFEELSSHFEQTHFPRGVAVAHSVRLGNIRLASDFSWLGRPEEIQAIFRPRLIQ